MKQNTTIIRKYAEADLKSKINIIFKYYPEINSIIDAHIAGMKYRILEEREYNRRSGNGELGVRVQSGNGYSDPTSNDGCLLADLETAIRACDFSGGVLDDIEQPERIIRLAHILREMRRMHNLCDMQILCLRQGERTLYQQYLNHKITISDIAAEYHIEYSSAVKKISRIRKCVQNGVIETIKFTSCQHGTK